MRRGKTEYRYFRGIIEFRTEIGINPILVLNSGFFYIFQKELHDYSIYSDNDIEEFCNVYYSGKKQDSTMMGKMTSALKPVADRYSKLATGERYNFRRQVRSYIKWYGYICQVCRMFDAEMQKVYVFCSYLLRLIPTESVQMIDIEGALQLEFYKLEQTFKGEIALVDQFGVYEPAGWGQGQGGSRSERAARRSYSEDLFAGSFSGADRVLIYTLHDRLKDDKKLQKVAKTSDRQVFEKSIFPKTFGEVAQDSYVEQTEAFTSLFQNESKYNAIMSALANSLQRVQ